MAIVAEGTTKDRLGKFVPARRQLAGLSLRQLAESSRTEDVIAGDPFLTETEKQPLLAVYRSYVSGRSEPRDR